MHLSDQYASSEVLVQLNSFKKPLTFPALDEGGLCLIIPGDFKNRQSHIHTHFNLVISQLCRGEKRKPGFSFATQLFLSLFMWTPSSLQHYGCLSGEIVWQCAPSSGLLLCCLVRANGKTLHFHCGQTTHQTSYFWSDITQPWLTKVELQIQPTSIFPFAFFNFLNVVFTIAAKPDQLYSSTWHRRTLDMLLQF